MKILSRAIIGIAFLFLLSPISAEESTRNVDVSSLETTVNCEQLKLSDLDSGELTKRGCCSWHDGVCGCSSGRQQCCDGTLSPSCTCNKSEPTLEIPKT